MKQQQTTQKRIRGRHPMAVKNGGNGNVHGGNGNNGRGSSQSSQKNVAGRRNAMQLYDRYTALARDAASSGDRVEAERHYQLAEHYYRTANPEGAERPVVVADTQPDACMFLEETAPVSELSDETPQPARQHSAPPRAFRHNVSDAPAPGMSEESAPTSNTPRPRAERRRSTTFAPPAPTVSAISFPFDDTGPQPDLSDQDIEKLIEESL